MVGQWNRFHVQLGEVLWVVFMLCLQGDGCLSLNLEGFALREFRLRVDTDPFGAFMDWNPDDSDPCNWSGVHCIGGKVAMLDLKGMSLGGTLAPELGKLSHLRALILLKNNFSGVIPKEIGGLYMLELLDLRGNNLTGEIPMEIGNMMSLKHLFLCNNSFHGGIPIHAVNLNMLLESQDNDCPLLDMDLEISYLNRKLQHWAKCGDGASCGNGKEYGPIESYISKGALQSVNSARRRLLQEPSNLQAAAPKITFSQDIVVVSSTGSGSFPAVPNSNRVGPGSNGGELVSMDPPAIPSEPALAGAVASGSLENQSKGLGRTWAYVLALPGAAFLLTVAAGMLVMLRTPANAAIGPWRTGLSGQLQKAFITGVPKLNRAELEAACEDFSNIIHSFPDCTIFKGTLSSGVEIAVVSTAVASSKDWSKSSEVLFQKKIDSLSRVNHKNFVNLLGYCEENEPTFMRMMVFEYAPNGTLYEHLHVKELEHLDWAMRTRIIMGIAYCLQHMHHDLNPPVVHPNLRSDSVFLTDDYAAKIAEIGFWKDVAARGRRVSGDDDSAFSESSSTHPECNVYDFGLLMLEIISGKHPYNEEQGSSVVGWAAEFLEDRRSIGYMIDPTLKSFKDSEVEVVCEMIKGCVNPDAKKRPTMREVTARLREVIAISPESATPRLSPLWWAELEILTEAS